MITPHKNINSAQFEENICFTYSRFSNEWLHPNTKHNSCLNPSEKAWHETHSEQFIHNCFRTNHLLLMVSIEIMFRRNYLSEYIVRKLKVWFFLYTKAQSIYIAIWYNKTTLSNICRSADQMQRVRSLNCLMNEERLL